MATEEGCKLFILVELSTRFPRLSVRFLLKLGGSTFRFTRQRRLNFEQIERSRHFPCRFGFFPRRDILVVGSRGALKGRLRVRAKGQAHRHSCLIETALHHCAACLRTTGFSMEDV